MRCTSRRSIGRPDERGRSVRRTTDARSTPSWTDPPDPSTASGSIESSNQPPLYYAARRRPRTWLRRGRTCSHRLWLMRLVSRAAGGADDALHVSSSCARCLRSRGPGPVGRWRWPFQPLFGFISGGVHPDALLFTASAALFFTAGARVSQRAHTADEVRRSVLALTVGLFTKLNFLALIPGALLGAGAACLACRARSTAGALRGGGRARSACWRRRWFCSAPSTSWSGTGPRPAASAAASEERGRRPSRRRALPRRSPVSEQLSYTWQLYLPRLPFMNDQFAYYPLWQTRSSRARSASSAGSTPRSRRGSTRSP